LANTYVQWNSNIKLSSHPFKFASQLSSHKAMKQSVFNFFSNLLAFTAKQTWQLVIKILKTKHRVAKVYDLI